MSFSACDAEPPQPAFRSDGDGDGGGDGETDRRLFGDAAPAVEDAEGNVEAAALVFASFVELNAAGDVVDFGTFGELSPEQRDRVARPWLYGTEDTTYVDEAWERFEETGTQLRGYRVWSHPSRGYAEEVGSGSGPATVNANVAEYVASAEPDEMLQIDLRLADYPAWDVPLRADPSFFSASDVLVREEARAAAMLQREELFAEKATNLESLVAAVGGSVVARFPKSGWLSVEIPLHAFEEFTAREDVNRIDGEYGETAEPTWDLGDGRHHAYMTADAFVDDSYDGGTANSARHAYGRITVGVTELLGFEEDACGFHNTGCGSDTRVVKILDCSDPDIDGNHCEPGSVESGLSICDGSPCDEHGTLTASHLGANYRDGQANGKQMGDSDWEDNTCTSSANCNGEPCVAGLCRHSEEWETKATGMAPEAALVLFGYADTNSGRADSFDDAVDLGIDISSNSWTVGGSCDLDSSSEIEDEIETAFDDGILVVFSAGNENGDDATTCNVREPADLPKVFTVNAYDASISNCEQFPDTRCLLDRDSCQNGDGCCARGGVTANVAGTGNVTDAVRAIDVVAPNNVGYGTTSSGTASFGTLSYQGFAGTSAAAPQVAGLAALQKDYRLSTGATWINDPGRLHTVMLAMSDRHFSTNPASGTTWTAQLTATPNHWYGLGRIKMRPFHRSGYWPVGANLSTYVFTGTGSTTFYPFGTDDLPAGIEIVKCVTLQREDMSGKSDISELKLEVRIRPNASPSACSGTPTFTRTSDHFDTNKIAAIDGATFTDRCVEVTLEAEAVTSAGTTTHTFCYYAGVTDDATP